MQHSHGLPTTSKFFFLLIFFCCILFFGVLCIFLSLYQSDKFIFEKLTTPFFFFSFFFFLFLLFLFFLFFSFFYFHFKDIAARVNRWCFKLNQVPLKCMAGQEQIPTSCFPILP